MSGTISQAGRRDVHERRAYVHSVQRITTYKLVTMCPFLSHTIPEPAPNGISS
jgi:hypothetical protein